MNLQEFIDMTAGEGEGQVMDYKSFIRNYTSNDWLYVLQNLEVLSIHLIYLPCFVWRVSRKV